MPAPNPPQNTMQLQFLGTGAGMPSKTRNVSAIALNLDQPTAQTWLFDCGEATQHTILHTPIRPGRIRRIFITHLHGDHIFGLPGLLTSRGMMGCDTPIDLYGPAGIRRYLDTVLETSASYLPYPLHIHEISEPGVVHEDGQHRVSAHPLNHGVPSYAYRIQESMQSGTLDVARLRAEGVPAGPLYRRLKEGETITLGDGRVLHGADYCASAPAERRIIIFGDTCHDDAHADFCRDADLIVHEATFAGGEEERAARHGHSTADQTARLARDAGAKQLYLTHISARYDEAETATLLERARTIFPATHLAHDRLVVDVPRATPRHDAGQAGH